MASEMRRKLGVRMAPHSNESSSYEMLSVLTDPDETLLGLSRHLELRDLGRNSLNSRKFSQNTWQKIKRKIQEIVVNTNLLSSRGFLGGFSGMYFTSPQAENNLEAEFWIALGKCHANRTTHHRTLLFTESDVKFRSGIHLCRN